jgi:hypothetical protein
MKRLLSEPLDGVAAPENRSPNPIVEPAISVLGTDDVTTRQSMSDRVMAS